MRMRKLWLKPFNFFVYKTNLEARASFDFKNVVISSESVVMKVTFRIKIMYVYSE